MKEKIIKKKKKKRKGETNFLTKKIRTNTKLFINFQEVKIVKIGRKEMNIRVKNIVHRIR